ncbi:hypothetical protein VTN02DRAFT_811 [Thermoascus thermophilus]
MAPPFSARQAAGADTAWQKKKKSLETGQSRCKGAQTPDPWRAAGQDSIPRIAQRRAVQTLGRGGRWREGRFRHVAGRRGHSSASSHGGPSRAPDSTQATYRDSGRTSWDLPCWRRSCVSLAGPRPSQLPPSLSCASGDLAQKPLVLPPSCLIQSPILSASPPSNALPSLSCLPPVLPSLSSPLLSVSSLLQPFTRAVALAP